MRILVLSDAHSDRRAVYRAVTAQSDADYAVFLGDGGGVQDIIEEHFGKRAFIVSGNCDYLSPYPGALDEVLGGKRIFACHGHRYGVKSSLVHLCETAKLKYADIVLFGHTHQPLEKYIDGIYYLNPGTISSRSLSGATYGLVDITASGILTNIVKF